MWETKNLEVKLGNLYLDAVSEEKKTAFFNPSKEILRKQPAILYDSGSGNVHMIPQDPEIAKKYSDVIKKKCKEILVEIKNKLKYENMEYHSKIKNEKKRIVPAKILKGTLYENSGFLFSFLSVSYNDTKYDLVFNRFFFDNDNKLNCILPCFQIKVYDKNKSEPPSIGFYPNISSDKEQWSKKDVYYNFDVGINEPEDKIAEKFLKFVIETEEKEKEKSN